MWSLAEVNLIMNSLNLIVQPQPLPVCPGLFIFQAVSAYLTVVHDKTRCTSLSRRYSLKQSKSINGVSDICSCF